MLPNTLRTAADHFVGIGRRKTAAYALVYRSVDHRTLKEVCTEIRKRTPSIRCQPYVSSAGFDPAVIEFAAGVLELQERRIRADYDVLARFKRLDVALSVNTARQLMRRFDSAPSSARAGFLTLLLFPPR